MGKTVKLIFRILAVLIAFCLLTMLFMPKYIEKNADGRITAEFYREKTNIDVIITGSSTVQAGVSPMVLYRDYGITAYDRSNSSQVMAISYAMIADAIKQNKPELVVCDVGFIYQPDDYVDEGASRKSLDALKWSKAKSDCIKAVMDPTENYLDYVFPILRFHSRWNDLSIEDFKYWIYKPDVTYNGQLLQFDQESNIEINAHMLDEEYAASDRNMCYLQKIIDICRENDVQLMLMKLPHIQGNWSNKLDEQIINIADENGIIYKNFLDEYDSFGFEELAEFADGQHMNSLGAEKFTKVLGEYIIENYSISDRRNDPDISNAFDKKLEKYEYAMKNRIPSEQKSE